MLRLVSVSVGPVRKQVDFLPKMPFVAMGLPSDGGGSKPAVDVWAAFASDVRWKCVHVFSRRFTIRLRNGCYRDDAFTKPLFCIPFSVQMLRLRGPQ